MQISVVVPTYRRPELLSRCLLALIDQTYDAEQYEIIIISDGPDELTKQLYNKLADCESKKIIYYALNEKKGPAAARNYGWLLAKGELVAFTDDDCIPDKNWLSNFKHAYEANKPAALTGKTIVPLPAKPTDYERNVAGLETADFITANCCCSKNALELTGGFDEEFKMAWREDSDLEFKLIQANIPIIKVENAIVVHPVRKASWGVSIKEQKKTMFNVLLYKKYPRLYRQKIQPSPPVHYYATIVAFIIFLTGIFMQSLPLTTTGGILWLVLTVLFILRRLQHTKLSPDHVLEMIVTSVFIPFLSIYWQLYGVIKYKAALI